MAKTAAKSCGFRPTLLTHLFTDVIEHRNELCVQSIKRHESCPFCDNENRPSRRMTIARCHVQMMLATLRLCQCRLPYGYFIDDKVTDIQQTIWHYERCRWFEKVPRARLATGKFSQDRSVAGINPDPTIEKVCNNQTVTRCRSSPKLPMV